MTLARLIMLAFCAGLAANAAFAQNFPLPAAQVAIYKPTTQIINNSAAATVFSDFIRVSDGSRIQNFAAASLLDGTLRISGSDQLEPRATLYTDASAQWWDWLTFSAAGGGATIQIPIALKVSGLLEGLAAINFGLAVGDYYTTVYQQLAVRWTTPNTFGGQYTTGTANLQVSIATGQWLQLGKQDFIGIVTVPVGVPVYWNMYMNGATGNYDFAHTASFAMQLPNGVTFTSQSAAFLTAVPEPAPALLWLMALPILMILLKRRCAPKFVSCPLNSYSARHIANGAA